MGSSGRSPRACDGLGLFPRFHSHHPLKIGRLHLVQGARPCQVRAVVLSRQPLGRKWRKMEIADARSAVAHRPEERLEVEGLALDGAKRAPRLVASNEGAAKLRTVASVETPGVEGDGDIQGEGVPAGHLEVEEGRDSPAYPLHVVHEQVGVNRAAGKKAALEGLRFLKE